MQYHIDINHNCLQEHSEQQSLRIHNMTFGSNANCTRHIVSQINESKYISIDIFVLVASFINTVWGCVFWYLLVILMRSRFTCCRYVDWLTRLLPPDYITRECCLSFHLNHPISASLNSTSTLWKITIIFCLIGCLWFMAFGIHAKVHFWSGSLHSHLGPGLQTWLLSNPTLVYYYILSNVKHWATQTGRRG